MIHIYIFLLFLIKGKLIQLKHFSQLNYLSPLEVGFFFLNNRSNRSSHGGQIPISPQSPQLQPRLQPYGFLPACWEVEEQEQESGVGWHGTACQAPNTQADKGVKSSYSRISWSDTADKQMVNSGLPAYSKYQPDPVHDCHQVFNSEVADIGDLGAIFC